jgi:hypothetical protein
MGIVYKPACFVFETSRQNLVAFSTGGQGEGISDEFNFGSYRNPTLHETQI